MKKTCPYCDNVFETDNELKKYHSYACARMANNLKKSKELIRLTEWERKKREQLLKPTTNM